MKKIFFTVVLFIFSLPALANFESKGAEIFNGSWQGEGLYRRNGETSDCRVFQMTFEGKANSLKFVTGERQCETHSEIFDPVQMFVVGEQLTWNGMQVGTIKDGFVTVEFKVPQEDKKIRHYRMSMRVEGSVMTYEESRRIVGETEPVITFAGIMTLNK